MMLAVSAVDWRELRACWAFARYFSFTRQAGAWRSQGRSHYHGGVASGRAGVQSGGLALTGAGGPFFGCRRFITGKRG